MMLLIFVAHNDQNVLSWLRLISLLINIDSFSPSIEVYPSDLLGLLPMIPKSTTLIDCQEKIE